MMKAGIIGDGIMGQLIAFSLENAGWKVSLFGLENPNNCSQAAAGLLTPVSEQEKNDLLIFELGMESLSVHWPTILEKLGGKIYFKQLGSLIVSHPRDQNDLKRFLRPITEKLDAKNYQVLNESDIRQLEPDLSNFQSGFYFPFEGQIDNQELLKKMAEYFVKRDVKYTKSTVVNDAVYLKDKSGTYKHFDFMFDCRGLEAHDIFENLRGVRGELIWLHAPGVSIKRPIRLLHPRYNLYVVPRPNNIFIIGASEIESEDNSPISVRTTLELLTAAYSIHPGFLEARILKTLTQCRPTLSDNLPKIKYADNWLSINGLYRHGFLIAPALAAEAMRWMQYGISGVHYPQLFQQQENVA